MLIVLEHPLLKKLLKNMVFFFFSILTKILFFIKGLTLDNIHETMDELMEVIADQREIDNAFMEGF